MRITTPDVGCLSTVARHGSEVLYDLRFANSTEEARLGKKCGMAPSGTSFRSHGICKELCHPIQSNLTYKHAFGSNYIPGVDRGGVNDGPSNRYSRADR
jgi:hypothetical protein